MRPTPSGTHIRHFAPVDLPDSGDAKSRRDLARRRTRPLHNGALVAMRGAGPKADDRCARKANRRTSRRTNHRTKRAGRHGVSRHARVDATVVAPVDPSNRGVRRRRCPPELLEERRDVEFVVPEIELLVVGIGEDVLANIVHAEHDAPPV
jgi:hypothetical protein